MAVMYRHMFMLCLTTLMMKHQTEATLHYRRGRLSTTIRLPSACNCAVEKAPKAGSKCWYFKDETKGECESRTCKPSYECQTTYTGLICMRRNTKTRIVPVDFRKCKSEQVSGVMYVPYSSGGAPVTKAASAPKTVSAPPQMSAPMNSEIAIIEKERKTKENQLKILKQQEKAEYELIHKLEEERILEEKKLDRTIVQEQKEKANKLHLETENERKLRELELLNEQEEELTNGNRNNGRKRKADHYIVVAHNSALGRFEQLKEAKQELRKISKKSKRSRCIFEVRNGEVKSNPREIEGVPQKVENGFNRFWWDQDDISRMYGKAVEYNMKLDKAKMELGKKKKGSLHYIVIVGKSSRGEFTDLGIAKQVLLMSMPVKSKQRRAIFEIHNNVVNSDVSVVGGEMQEYGMRAGFNRFWWGRNDIDRMYELALLFART